MTLADARCVLGIDPNQDPNAALESLRKQREHLAVLAKAAPSSAFAAIYQKRLQDFDNAYAVIREAAVGMGTATPSPEPAGTPGLNPPLGAPVVSGPNRLRWVGILGCLLVCGAAVGGGWWHYQNEKTTLMQRQARIAQLTGEGAGFVENRRWQDAARSFSQIETLSPGSELARLGHRSIEVGMNEEQTQFVGYWTGQAITELESGRLDEAQRSIGRVLEKLPAEPDALTISERIAAARSGLAREAAILAARKLAANRQWDAAIAACHEIFQSTPANPEAQSILSDATTARDNYRADQAKAKLLLEQAIARDHGQFDAQALDALREAATLAPDDALIAAQLEKMASYTRTLRVPGDFATPGEAIAAARPSDRIVLAAQTWKGPLVVNAAIELQGAGSTQTTVECPATAGSAITLGPDAQGARISGITFRHEAFHALGNERFSAALVRGATVTFRDCGFIDASGHGLMVIDQGSAIAQRCRFADNAWNGAAANGKNGVLEVRDSEALNNFEHGIETWNGSALTAVNNRCEGNCLNGIHADNGIAAATIKDNQLISNREFGLVLESASSGDITGNIARSNLMGGLVIRAVAAALTVTGNQATLNHGPGMVLESGLPPASYSDNSLSHNTQPQLLSDVTFSQPNEKIDQPPSKK
ncbi:MAG: hypothetical protein RLZZ282_1273 [Verrucomicrobiota bacterium]